MTSNNFSAVMLGDLNDFIAPSQACVNPIFVNSQKEDNDSATKTKVIELKFDDDIPKVSATKSLIKLDKQTKTAKVSLSDCLACSGCVTSAETVLLKQQSVNEFLTVSQQVLNTTHPTYQAIAVTISPQVRASFSVRFGCNPVIAYAKIKFFLKHFCGVQFVLDSGSLPSQVSQVEVAKEFVRRFRENRTDGRLPLLTSSCPGWVCYAEKTHPHVLPFLSQVKSSQQSSGLILKTAVAQSLALKPDQIYHVTVMQCPDKKLEGARKESWLGGDASSAEVNCVLTATELCDLMIEKIPNRALDEIFAEMSTESTINQIEIGFGENITVEERRSGGSGGLCAFVFRYAARELFGVNIPADASLPFRQGHNQDTWSLDLELDGKKVLRFSASYGFRNIQDVVRRIKNRNAKHDFIEVMACPGGCTNGGGLLLPVDNKIENRRAIAENVSNTMDLVQFKIPVEIPNETLRIPPELLYTAFNSVKDSQNSNGLVQAW